jgi:hypothetical protein
MALAPRRSRRGDQLTPENRDRPGSTRRNHSPDAIRHAGRNLARRRVGRGTWVDYLGGETRRRLPRPIVRRRGARLLSLPSAASLLGPPRLPLHAAPISPRGPPPRPPPSRLPATLATIPSPPVSRTKHRLAPLQQTTATTTTGSLSYTRFCGKLEEDQGRFCSRASSLGTEPLALLRGAFFDSVHATRIILPSPEPCPQPPPSGSPSTAIQLTPTGSLETAKPVTSFAASDTSNSVNPAGLPGGSFGFLLNPALLTA